MRLAREDLGPCVPALFTKAAWPGGSRAQGVRSQESQLSESGMSSPGSLEEKGAGGTVLKTHCPALLQPGWCRKENQCTPLCLALQALVLKQLCPAGLGGMMSLGGK